MRAYRARAADVLGYLLAPALGTAHASSACMCSAPPRVASVPRPSRPAHRLQAGYIIINHSLFVAVLVVSYLLY